MTDIDLKLKKTFRNTFPEYAKRLDNAGTEETLIRQYNEILDECMENIKEVLGNDTALGEMLLSPERYHSLISATGTDIKYEIQEIMNGIQALKGLDNENDLTVQMLITGVTAITTLGVITYYNAVKAGADSFKATLAAVSASEAGVVAVAAFIVIAILIPIIYLMTKPASCIVLLINELEEDITFADDYNVSGERVCFTRRISKAVQIGEAESFSSGLFVTTKKDNALFGTQYGFSLKGTSSNDYFLFGVECPLTSTYTDNNCYCALTGSAKDAAEGTANHNNSTYEIKNTKYLLDIKCHSKAGSVAFYVARIRTRR